MHRRQSMLSNFLAIVFLVLCAIAGACAAWKAEGL